MSKIPITEEIELIDAQAKILTWAMPLCGSGMTPAMIRKLLHNKLIEITGEGQKA